MYERLLSAHQLVAFQETKFNKEDSLQSNEHFIHVADSGARCFWSDTTSPIFNGRHGVGLAMSSTSPFGDVEDLTASVYKEQLRNRYLLLKTALGGETVYLHVVYAPDEPMNRGEYYRALPTGFDADEDDVETGAKHIVVGDFNLTMDDYLDQTAADRPHLRRGREELEDWLDTLGLVDAWRFMHPEVRDFTSPSRKNRLDYCFVTADLLQDNLISVKHIRDQKWHNEDHIPVAFSLEAKRLQRTGRPPWRCPPWLLRDATVQDYLIRSVEALADRIKIFPGANPGCLLDEHKRADCIYLRRRWLELRKADERKMAAKIDAVNDATDLVNVIPTEENHTALEQAKLDLQSHREDIKARNEYKKFAADLHLSERATSYFFRAPQSDCLRSPITALTQEDGTVTDDQDAIATGHRQFWGRIFQSTSSDLRDQRTATYKPLKLAKLLRDTTTRLDAQQQAMLDAPITANDLFWAITTSKNGKAPGPDGLPIEYYKLASNLWAQIYEVVYGNQLEKGKMTKFQRRAHLSLLYKSGDRTMPGNYRPLTLLNHDAKLGPKVMQRRLGGVLPFLIHEDQSGFVPGRSIRHSLLRFQDLQEICKTKYPDACAVLLDFAKAFDSVLWPALDMVLQHFGFGATFRAWVKTFYNETSVSLLLNDCPGDPFLLGAGVRQGDPLSPGLFVVFVEPMMNFLRARFASRGIPVDDVSLRHLLLAFADDCTGLVSTLEDAEQFLELVQEYADAAGLRLNVEKTCIMPFSHHVSSQKLTDLRDRSNFKVLTPWESVKLLGIQQGATITSEQRFNDVLKKIRARCALWKYRARTLRGKVVILQSIILPLLWYTASVTSTPQVTLKEVDVIIRNFVNSQDTSASQAAPGKFDKEWIYTSVKDGGLGLTHPKSFIDATHLKCLRDGIATVVSTSAEPRWMAPALALFSMTLGSLGTGFDILYANMKGGQWSSLPQYWRSTLKLWSDLQVSHGTTDWKPFAQVMPFWDNIYFTFGKAKRPMSDVSADTIVRLKELDFRRLQDYVDFNGTYVTPDLLEMLLDDADFARPRSKKRLVNDTVRRLSLITPGDGPYYGPHRPTKVESACHGWCFNNVPVVDMANRDFVSLVLKARQTVKTPNLPLRQLGLGGLILDDRTWIAEYGWDRHVLPVCSDVKFRLQHNALGVRYKFKWRTQVDTSITCVHGCEDTEDAKHLFWECRVARVQWECYLKPFEDLIVGDIDWTLVVFSARLQLKPTSNRLYGEHAMQVVFNIIRCCVLRALWLHRNKRLYNPEVSTSAPFVKHHAQAYIKLHLRKLAADAATKPNSPILKLVNKITRALLPMATGDGDEGGLVV
ncbi:Reverse transcriptase (RNA-dependent DNA polymerase) [Phytophthora infestans]|uniref:Reverse transcriptase (RNA-dependent DNA polymerase) n=1 Tax=Phytophthora infestans TaxID=4787 RepID=A0A8S9U8P2_PHYIN|nr:Reverse transcriptase (RNA-dependent DNA polymerase) [Phytophthora infestans]